MNDASVVATGALSEVAVPPAGNTVHREIYRFDSAEYEITVFAASGGLYGTFLCPDCGFTGVSPLMSGSQDEALALAIDNLRIHHRENHATA
jgi:hypothetical protein